MVGIPNNCLAQIVHETSPNLSGVLLIDIYPNQSADESPNDFGKNH